MYKEAWTNFLRHDLVPQQFPREMMLYRKTVASLDEYLDILSTQFDKANCYVSLYSNPQREQGVIDTIFFEVDGDRLCPRCDAVLTQKDKIHPYKMVCQKHGSVYPVIDLADAHDRAETLRRYFKKLRLYARRYFSGRRGYHFYIDIEPIKLKNPGWAIKQVFKDAPAGIDFSVLGDIRQMVRVPFTQHAATGFFCYPVFSTASFEEALNPEVHIPIRQTNDLAAELSAADTTIPVYPDIVGEMGESKLFPPCIVDGLVKLQERRELSHPHRFHLAAFLSGRGFSVDTAVSLFRGASDFRLQQTKYQVEKIAQGSMKCYGCERAHNLKICPLGPKRWQCPFWPSVNLRMG